MNYSGKLKDKIVRKKMGSLATEEAYMAEAKRITDERFAKLPALFDAHGLKEGDWMGLAFALAIEHVPGFQLSNPAGRSVVWTESLKAEFRLDVDTVKTQQSISVAESIKLVIRQERWKEVAGPLNLPALEAHYYHADLRWVKLVADARAYELIVGKD